MVPIPARMAKMALVVVGSVKDQELLPDPKMDVNINKNHKKE
jgi:hypothetical protein